MKLESLKVLAHLFYSRAVGRLGLGPDPLGMGFGGNVGFGGNEPEVGDILTDGPTQPRLEIAPSGPRMIDNGKISRLQAEAAAFKKIVAEFIKENFTAKNFNSKNVRYWNGTLKNILSSADFVLKILSPEWQGNRAGALRDLVDHFHELNIEFGEKGAICLMQYKNFEQLHTALMAMTQVLDDVAYDVFSNPNLGFGESVA